MEEQVVAEIPSGAAKSQTESLDQAIVNAGKEDLPNILSRIAEIPSAIEREIYVRKLSEVLEVSRRAIQSDLSDAIKIKGAMAQRIQKCASFDGLVDVVLNDKGSTTYLIKNGQNLELKSQISVKGQILIPPDERSLLFDPIVKGEEVIDRYLKGNDPTLFDDVMNHLKRFSYLQDQHWLVATNFVFLTYLHDHRDVFYMPIIYFFASPGRGKTRTGKSMAYLSYRGHHCIDLKQAQMFRTSDYLRNSVFYDVVDIWATAAKAGATDILLARFERSGKVIRVTNYDRGAFDDMRSFDVFSPTIMASNVTVNNILETRCIPITMVNMPGNYDNPSADKFNDLKIRMTAWRARVMDRPLPQIQPIEGIDGRLWDITQPLLQVCQMVSPGNYENLVRTLLEISNISRSEQRDTTEGRIVSIIRDVCEDESDSGVWIIATLKVLKMYNSEARHEMSPQGMGRKLKAMGIKTRIIGGYSQIQIDRSTLNTLLDQYGYDKLLKNPKPTLAMVYDEAPADAQDTESDIYPERTNGGEEITHETHEIHMLM